MFSFSLKETGGKYEGEVLSPWKEGTIVLEKTDAGFSGRIDNTFFFSGSINVVAIEPPDHPLRDYEAIAKTLFTVTKNKVFNPADLKKEAFLKFKQTFDAIASSAHDDLDFLIGFHLAWMNDPFSHYDLKRSEMGAADMMAFFDTFEIGQQAAYVKYEDDIAVLTVDTMMGLDTIRYINQAFDDIAEKQPKALIIDLRNNGGGAFAVKPLVEHIIDEPLDAGYFMSNQWNQKNGRLPNKNEVAALTPWKGWSILAFWKDVQEQGLMKIRFEPAQPNYDGPVYVLTSKRTASAAEMALDALRSSGKVTIIGETSSGEMLSQSMYDVQDGFMLSLPIADYISIKNGRIEGVGVPVDVEVEAGQALEKAKEVIGN